MMSLRASDVSDPSELSYIPRVAVDVALLAEIDENYICVVDRNAVIMRSCRGAPSAGRVRGSGGPFRFGASSPFGRALDEGVARCPNL
ncbi:hypothetical protein EVAR_43503_1 [Eumeta japonica]|uniref:Uncharacterized protein n=1 Tax=Eumeta variegata TaxID=151549 RepID=A0A4C1YMK0_EUMVA|nr:hypothetical protein EVAR_43503_1 [Eumeta japonica]